MIVYIYIYVVCCGSVKSLFVRVMGKVEGEGSVVGGVWYFICECNEVGCGVVLMVVVVYVGWYCWYKRNYVGGEGIEIVKMNRENISVKNWKEV